MHHSSFMTNNMPTVTKKALRLYRTRKSPNGSFFFWIAKIREMRQGGQNKIAQYIYNPTLHILNYVGFGCTLNSCIIPTLFPLCYLSYEWSCMCPFCQHMWSALDYIYHASIQLAKIQPVRQLPSFIQAASLHEKSDTTVDKQTKQASLAP